MTERVKKLREQSINAVPRVSPERARIVTGFYKEAQFLSAPMRRALTFRRIMEQKEICINDGELIVGERGPEVKRDRSFPLPGGSCPDNRLRRKNRDSGPCGPDKAYREVSPGVVGK